MNHIKIELNRNLTNLSTKLLWESRIMDTISVLSESEIENRFEAEIQSLHSSIEEIKTKQIEDTTQLKDLLQVENLKLTESNNNLR